MQIKSINQADTIPTFAEPAVFDVDGTLRCGAHRLHLLPPLDKFADPRAFDAMNMAAVDDTPIWDNINLLKAIHKAGHPIVLLTRANVMGKDILLAQLALWDIPYVELIMADYDDTRGDRDYKEEKIQYIEEKYGRPIAFWDDQPKVCAHIRALGYTCHHVVDPYLQNNGVSNEADFN